MSVNILKREAPFAFNVMFSWATVLALSCRLKMSNINEVIFITFNSKQYACHGLLFHVFLIIQGKMIHLVAANSCIPLF
jgi:hypothetical protein